MITKSKVISYIFRNNKTEILVFDHRDFSDAGTQVIGGTLEDNEDLKDALQREIKEESGILIQTEDMIKIGETQYARKDRPEINHRYYFEIEIHALLNQWSHVVQSNGQDNGMVFNFYWMSIEEAKKNLTGNLGELLV